MRTKGPFRVTPSELAYITRAGDRRPQPDGVYRSYIIYLCAKIDL